MLEFIILWWSVLTTFQVLSEADKLKAWLAEKEAEQQKWVMFIFYFIFLLLPKVNVINIIRNIRK